MEGTDLSKSVEKCFCLPDYYGSDCGIPDAVWFGHYATRPKDREKLKVRKVPRRIIHGVPVNHEFDFFETRIKTIGDVVDAFIVQVSPVVKTKFLRCPNQRVEVVESAESAIRHNIMAHIC